MKRTLLGVMCLGMTIMPQFATGQQIDPPFEIALPSRLDLLKQDNAWHEIALRTTLGTVLYESVEIVASHALPAESQNLANELALVATLAAAVGSEAASLWNANDIDGVPARFKRVDSGFDAIETAFWGLQDYAGTQFGWKERLAVGLIGLALDWHFLPERDLRR